MKQLNIFLLLISVSELGAVPLLMSCFSSLALLDTDHPSNMTYITQSTSMVIAVDYHYKRGEIYFSDLQGHINRAWLKTGAVQKDPLVIVDGLQVMGLAVDWINDNLYWTDLISETIEVASLDGLNRRSLFDAEDDRHKPRAIVVDPLQGLLFWSDGIEHGKVYSSSLNGKSKRLVADNLCLTNGLTLDLNGKKLYILESNLHKLSSCSYDGSNLKELFQSANSLQLAFGLTYYSDNLYWRSWKEGAMVSLNISTQRESVFYKPEKFGLVVVRPKGLKAIHHLLQPYFPQSSACNNKHCSHQCVEGPPGTASCMCPYGHTLDKDEYTCVEEGYMLVSWGSSIRRNDLNGTNEQLMLNPTTLTTSIDVHLKRNLVFWCEEHRIYRAPIDQLHNKTVVMKDESCAGLAVDWVHDVLYWTDVIHDDVKAASLDGSHHTTVINTSNDQDQPRYIVLDPIEGLLFWTSLGTYPKIESASLDGSDRKVIITTNIASPNGLSIDFDEKRLYWTDGALKTISSCLYDGTKRLQLLRPQIVSLQPLGISVLGDFLYWTDLKLLYKSHKINNMKTTEVLVNSSSIFLRPKHIRIVHSSLQQVKNNSCLFMKCSSLCLGSLNDRQARCVGEETVPDIQMNEGIEQLIVYEKSRTEVFFRCSVTNRTANHLVKFSGNYSITGSHIQNSFEVPAVPCTGWKNFYCFNISRLTSNEWYSFNVSAVVTSTVGIPRSASVHTKEEKPGPPEDVHVISYASSTNNASIDIQWLRPNETNGILRSFVINIHEVDTFDEDKCCKSYNIIEIPVLDEEHIYSAKVEGLTPASTYAISVSSKTQYIGGTAEIDVYTAPPPMNILRMLKMEASSLPPISWKSQDTIKDESSTYKSLIKSYILLNKRRTQNTPSLNVTNIGIEPLQTRLEAEFGDKFVILWHKQSDDDQAFNEPIKIAALTSGEELELVWVQVSQYKAAYSLDYIVYEPFVK